MLYHFLDRKLHDFQFHTYMYRIKNSTNNFNYNSKTYMAECVYKYKYFLNKKKIYIYRFVCRFSLIFILFLPLFFSSSSLTPNSRKLSCQNLRNNLTAANDVRSEPQHLGRNSTDFLWGIQARYDQVEITIDIPMKSNSKSFISTKVCDSVSRLASVDIRD